MSETPQILLAHHLKKLKLPTFLREHEKIARLCAAENRDYTRFLLRLAELELIDREGRMVERRIKAAHFPTVKSLDSFDFKAIPSLNKTLVLELAHCEYVDRRENIIALGNSGTGRMVFSYAHPIFGRRSASSATAVDAELIPTWARCAVLRLPSGTSDNPTPIDRVRMKTPSYKTMAGDRLTNKRGAL